MNMPLMKAALAQELERIFQRKPASAAEAAMAWVNAYHAYASAALSMAGGVPVTAAAHLSVLQNAFAGAFQAQTPMAAASAMAQGVLSFWSALQWIGPVGAGTTISPGNLALAVSLGAVFADSSSQQSIADKASRFADAFDAGARLVVVSDIPFIQPTPPVVGPIS
jgi:hypothetical protein